MTISKTKSGRWRVRVKDGRAVIADKTFDLKRDAESFQNTTKRALLLGDFIDPQVGKELLKSVVIRWLEAREHTVASSTLKADKALLRNLPAQLGNRPVASIRSNDIDPLLSALVSKGLAVGSVRRFRAVISSLFSWAVQHGLTAKNPVLGTRVPSGTGTGKAHDVYPLTVEELRSVTEQLRAKGGRQGDIALVLGLSGLRWGELVALRVRDVTEVPQPALLVSRSAPDGHEVRNVTKSGKARSVPLAAELIPVFEKWTSGKSPDDLVFTSPDGQRLNGSNWRRAVGWPEFRRNRRVHDLRHTAATFWLSNHIEPKVVQKWLGHASMTLTVDLYSHWMGSGADQAAIAQVNAALGDAGGTRGANLRASSD